MPTYSYVCPKCGREFEAKQRMSESPLTNCPSPACDGVPKRQIAGATTFVLLGKGWYKDGY